METASCILAADTILSPVLPLRHEDKSLPDQRMERMSDLDPARI
jgi:hypothetical protein